eukprot:Skav208038  [mRNA]  locus=scaffold2540:106182:113768:+ [translate_table: standard]
MQQSAPQDVESIRAQAAATLLKAAEDGTLQKVLSTAGQDQATMIVGYEFGHRWSERQRQETNAPRTEQFAKCLGAWKSRAVGWELGQELGLGGFLKGLDQGKASDAARSGH